MSNKLRLVKSDFLQAAEAFDSELEGFYRLVDATLRGPLNSVKHLERAANSLNQVADCEQRLSAASQVLSAAIANGHAQQLEQAQRLQERAQLISLRTSQFHQLMEGYRTLGAAATALNTATLEFGRKKKEAGASAELVQEFQSLQGQMLKVAQTAQELVEAARGAEFEDIARQIDAIRQQLVAASAPKILR